MLSLSSNTPTKASISTNSNNINSNNKFFISNQDINNINASVGNTLKSNTNNNVINNNQTVLPSNNTINQSTNKFITNDTVNIVNANKTNNINIKPSISNNNANNQMSQRDIQNTNANNNVINNISNPHAQQSTNKFISDEPNSSVKNINISSKSIFNVSNNQNMTLNSNNSTYPNYANNNNNNSNNKSVGNSNIGNNNQNIQSFNNEVVDKQKQKTDKLMKKTFVPLVELEHKTIRQNKLFMGILIGSVAIFIIVISIALFASGTKISFFGGSPYYSNIKHEKTNDYETFVVAENTWKNVNVKTKEEAYELIRKDSETQKQRCRDELGIKYEKVEQMEKKLEKEYNIIAVNLCEIDINYLINLEKRIKKVYQEFPILKNYMTNLSIANASYIDRDDKGVIAQFNPATSFATPNSFLSGKSEVKKTRIYLNAKYVLDQKYLEEVVNDNVESNHFIPNADKYSIVIHEFGHYLSFIATLRNNNKIDSVLLRNSKNISGWNTVITDYNSGDTSYQILEEALHNYITNPKYRKYSHLYSGSSTESIDIFRADISGYANSVDYDEAVAEAFHDYFVNGVDGAKPQSIEIIKVLKKYLGY